MVEEHGSASTSQDKSNTINNNYETFVVEERGRDITTQDMANTINNNYETVVVEKRGRDITTQDMAINNNYETVVVDNTLDNRIVLVKDSNNKYTIKGFYNSFK